MTAVEIMQCLSDCSQSLRQLEQAHVAGIITRAEHQLLGFAVINQARAVLGFRPLKERPAILTDGPDHA